MTAVVLEFDNFSIEADLYDGVFRDALLKKLPLTIPLTAWGEEVYGPVPFTAGDSNLVEVISPGGIAYTSRGNYFCIFFGQNPAWPVEEVGRIRDEQWHLLRDNSNLESLLVRLPHLKDKGDQGFPV